MSLFLTLALAAPALTAPFSPCMPASSNAPVVTLTKSGVCPGPMTLTINGATPNGQVAVLYGVPSSYTYNGTPCTGIVLGIVSIFGTAPTLATTQPANGAGTLIINFNAPASVCGLTVQAVDISSCTTSNTVTL